MFFIMDLFCRFYSRLVGEYFFVRGFVVFRYTFIGWVFWSFIFVR